jgi:hypothetical protein
MVDITAAAIFALRRLNFISNKIANDYVYNKSGGATHSGEVAALQDSRLKHWSRPAQDAAEKANGKASEQHGCADGGRRTLQHRRHRADSCEVHGANRDLSRRAYGALIVSEGKILWVELRAAAAPPGVGPRIGPCVSC